MSPIMLIQHGEKMTKLCAVGLRPYAGGDQLEVIIAGPMRSGNG